LLKVPLNAKPFIYIFCFPKKYYNIVRIFVYFQSNFKNKLSWNVETLESLNEQSIEIIIVVTWRGPDIIFDWVS